MVKVGEMSKDGFIKKAEEHGLLDVTDNEWQKHAKDRRWSLTTAMNRIRGERKQVVIEIETEELYTEHWPTISRRVKNRDKCCVVCGSTTGLHTHHIIRIHTADELMGKDKNSDWNLITLCKTCHEFIHTHTKYRRWDKNRIYRLSKYVEAVNRLEGDICLRLFHYAPPYRHTTDKYEVHTFLYSDGKWFQVFKWDVRKATDALVDKFGLPKKTTQARLD